MDRVVMTLLETISPAGAERLASPKPTDADHRGGRRSSDRPVPIRRRAAVENLRLRMGGDAAA
ncbi:MAG: hypothetical protein ACJ77N_08975 [Chloroflexota bacterium]|jgi:hypothetical protein